MNKKINEPNVENHEETVKSLIEMSGGEAELVDLSKDDKIIIEAEVNDTEARLNETGLLSADMIKDIKKTVMAEVIEELKDDKVLKEKELMLQREDEDVAHAGYVAKMKLSDEPWHELISSSSSKEKGMRLEMDWNDAFIKWLNENGITGIDQDATIEKYLLMLLSNQIENDKEKKGGDYA